MCSFARPPEVHQAAVVEGGPQKAHFNTFDCRRLRNRPRCRIHPGYLEWDGRNVVDVSWIVAQL